ncbi:uncharacterized protein TNCV_3170901 [Trichonephila clavipes]|nr:uncharacterized protein TNCV_3170901 [Trichonephila clavipes]
MAALVSEYTLEFLTLLNARGKKELIEWCMKEGLIASSYECPKCNEQMGLNERKSVVLDGFEWRCRKKGVNTHDVCRIQRCARWRVKYTETPAPQEANSDQDVSDSLCSFTDPEEEILFIHYLIGEPLSVKEPRFK